MHSDTLECNTGLLETDQKGLWTLKFRTASSLVIDKYQYLWVQAAMTFISFYFSKISDDIGFLDVLLTDPV